MHGMEAHNYTGTIRIAAEEHRDDIRLVLSDTGTGMTEQRLEQLKEILDGEQTNEQSSLNIGIGLQNVNKRLQLHFGSHYRLEIESEINRGTTVTLRFPKFGNGTKT